MGKVPQGDIPGNRDHIPLVGTHAAVASGGANSRQLQFGPLAFDVRMRNVWWSPTSADQAATQTATYRRLSVYNGGASGTGTATASRMASLNLTASLASLGAREFTVDTTVTLASGQIAYFSQETVGGTDANGSVLAGGQYSLAYEVL
jgi:hypothetical protein